MGRTIDVNRLLQSSREPISLDRVVEAVRMIISTIKARRDGLTASNLGHRFKAGAMTSDDMFSLDLSWYNTKSCCRAELSLRRKYRL